jgi:hypothetical protein
LYSFDDVVAAVQEDVEKFGMRLERHPAILLELKIHDVIRAVVQPQVQSPAAPGPGRLGFHRVGVAIGPRGVQQSASGPDRLVVQRT